MVRSSGIGDNKHAILQCDPGWRLPSRARMQAVRNGIALGFASHLRKRIRGIADRVDRKSAGCFGLTRDHIPIGAKADVERAMSHKFTSQLVASGLTSLAATGLGSKSVALAWRSAGMPDLISPV